MFLRPAVKRGNEQRMYSDSEADSEAFWGAWNLEGFLCILMSKFWCILRSGFW